MGCARRLHHSEQCPGQELPPQQRTAVWATKELAYTHAETAAAMNKKPETVATHVVRAVAALRVHRNSYPARPSYGLDG
ncbi:sigma-70 region 4 domain-containing protein [Streptomyces sp. NPDC054765]